MDKATIETNAENIALANFLSNVPDGMTYEEILDCLDAHDIDELDEKEIVIWAPFEYHSPKDVRRYIEDLHDSIVWNFTKEA